MENGELNASQENSSHMDKYMDYSGVKFLKNLKTDNQIINLKDYDLEYRNSNNNFYDNDNENENNNIFIEDNNSLENKK